VMYGETSAPQFLQTTKRSGLLAMDPVDSTEPGQAGGTACQAAVASTISAMTSRRSWLAS
jgi:hypothetical protein